MPGEEEGLPEEYLNPKPEEEVDEEIAIELPHEDGDENAQTV